MKVILSLICLCFWVHSYAQFDDSKIESTLSEDQKKELKKNYLKDTKSDHELAVKLMRLDFAPYIKKLNRDIVTYNYRMPNEFSSKDNSALDMKSDSQDAIEYASKWAKAAKNP